MTLLLWIALIAFVILLVVAVITVFAEPDMEGLLPILTVMRVLGIVVLLAVFGEIVMTTVVGITSAVAP